MTGWEFPKFENNVNKIKAVIKHFMVLSFLLFVHFGIMVKPEFNLPEVPNLREVPSLT
jgi:hypothetical protein